MDLESEYDVVVVGLGPVGLILSAALGRAGHKVLALEASDGKHVSPRATAMDDEAVRLVAQTGVLNEFLQDTLRAGPIQVMQDYISEGSDREPEMVFGWEPRGPGGGHGKPGAWPALQFPQSRDVGQSTHNGVQRGSFLFYQPRLEELYRNVLRTMPNVTLRFNCACAGLVEEHEQPVTVTVERTSGKWVEMAGGEKVYETEQQQQQQQQVSARFVVGCDGSRSSVRQYINPGPRDFISLDYDKEWVAVDIMLKDERAVMGTKLSNFSHMLCTPDRQYIVIPCSYCYDQPSQGRHIRFDFSVNQAVDPADRTTMESKEFIHSLLAPSLDEDDYTLVRGAVYRFHCLIAPKWRRGSVFVAGDSAHTMPPFLGQGLNAGIKDVGNLWWKLSAALNGRAKGDELLASYQSERYPVALHVVAHAMKLGQVLTRFSEAAAEGGPSKVLAAKAEAEQEMDSKLNHLWNVAYTTLDIPRKVHAQLRSKWDGATLRQFRVKPVHPASPFTSLSVDQLMPRDAPFAALLVGLENAPSAALSPQQRAFFAAASIPIFHVCLKSERRELPNAAEDDAIYWVEDLQDPDILQKCDLVVFRRDLVVFGVAVGEKQIDALCKELEWSQYFELPPAPKM